MRKVFVFVLFFVVVFVSALVLLGYVWKDGEDPHTPGHPSPPSAPKAQDSSVTAKGKVESTSEILISSDVSAVITNIPAQEGESVEPGQVLVQLDDKKIRAQVRLAEARMGEAEARIRELRTRLGQATADYKRQKRLYGKHATTKVELEQALEKMKVTRAELDKARASVRQAHSEVSYYRSLLEDYTIVAPMEGIVSERFKDPYETADVGTPILTLIDPHSLRVRAELEESDVGTVHVGQPVEVYSEANRHAVYHGTVYKVFSTVKRRSQRTFDPMASFDVNTQTLYISLDDYEGLTHNMTVTVRFLKEGQGHES